MVTPRFLRNALFAALAAALALSAAPAAAGTDSLGQENVGTAGAQFLRIPVGARAVSLGQACTADAIDGATPFWNPAGLMRTLGRRNFFASHVAYTADIDLDYASYHWRRQNFGFAITAGMLRSGDIPRTTELHQEDTGQFFEANQYFLGLSLARAMTDRFSFGGTAKFYQENLDEFEVRSVLLDLGVLYFVGLGDLRVGFALRNFGPDLKPGGTPPPIGPGYDTASEFQSFSAPTSGSFGTACTWDLANRLTLLTTADFHHPADFAESFRLGAELGLDRMFYLRSGYETNRDEGGFAAGFGVRLTRDQLDVRLDYAYSDMGAFGEIHHFSVDLVPVIDKRRLR